MLGSKLQAQVKVYLSHQAPPYFNLFNGQRQIVKLTYNIREMRYAYPIQIGITFNKIGIELGKEDIGNTYYQYDQLPPNGTLMSVRSRNRYILITKNVFSNKYISIVPKGGIVHSDYYSEIFTNGIYNAAGKLVGAFIGGEEESRWGIMSGLHVNANLFKGLYATTNIRYAYYPYASYNHMNLSVGVGLDFTFTVKKAK